MYGSSLIVLRHLLLAAYLLPGLAAGALPSGQTQSEHTAIFRAFGERPGLVRIVDDLMLNLLADPRTQVFFENADQEHIKAMLVEQLCEILGGPCIYTGEDMGKVHRRQKITTAHFNALVEDLQDALDKNGIPYHAQNRLMAKLAAMHKQVITR